MSEFANAMEVFKLLDKSNCRKCNELTCLAFASKVFLGSKSLDQCPVLSPKILERFKGTQKQKSRVRADQDAMLAEVKDKIQSCDLEAVAKRVGGTFSNGKLTIRVLGKPFAIDSNGNMFSDIHINFWVAAPVLNYVLYCKGIPLTGQWIPLRELKGGKEKTGLFVQRPLKSFKKIADRYPNLFEDLIFLFNGKKVKNHNESDISLVIHPLPRLPILICYWKPDEQMDSDLNLFFDSSADMNASLDIVYGIASGIVNMFEKISMKHGAK